MGLRELGRVAKIWSYRWEFEIFHEFGKKFWRNSSIMKSSPIRPALSEILSILMPSPEETQLLQACLWPGEPGRQAWTKWQRGVGDPVELLKNGNERLKSLLPLIYTGLRDNNIVVEESLQTCLRTGYMREELRINTYRRILSRVLSAYTEKQIPLIVLRGAALAETVYDSPSRHSGEIEILFGDFESFRAALSSLPSGFQVSDGEIGPAIRQIKLVHESGLPLFLHLKPIPIAYYDLSFKDLWKRSQIRTIAGVPARILSPTDNLMQVCGTAFCSRSRRSLLWAFDSWLIITKYSKLDWNGLLTSARRHHLELPLSITLGYLAEELNAPIPVSFLESLHNGASKTDSEGQAYALSVALDEMRLGHLRTLTAQLVSNRQWRTLAYVIRRLFLSPVNSLRRFWPIHNSKA